MPPVYLEKVLRHAERELVHQSHLRPTDLLDIYRRFLKIEEHRLKLEHVHGEGGRELCRKRADVISVMLRHLWNGAWETHLRSHMEKPPQITLLAVGGFGRGELNPYSDIDILFLHHAQNAKATQQVTDIVESVLYMLWDIGFQVGHATRSLNDVVTQANDDLRTKTSLLEARYLAGDDSLSSEYEKTFERRCLHGHEKEYLAWRVGDQRERHEKAGSTPFLQEPNVKNGCGGLRDYQNMLWVGRVKRGYTNTQALVDAQLLTPTERKQLDRAYDFLLRIRTELHYLQKRAGDVLTLRLQAQIADSFGYQHRTILRKMEAFMRDYYENTSLLYNLGNTVSNRLCGSGKTQAKWAFLPFHAKHHEEIDGFVLENGEFEAIPDTNPFAEEPVRLVRIFLLAQQHNAGIGPELKLRLRRRLYLIDRRFIYQNAVRETLLAILSRKGQVGRALRMMHELGYLGRFFPEFRPLTCLVQHEFFHRYTADEHTLVCIEMLDKIIDATEPPFVKYKQILQNTAKPHILYLAMLLHDTGKSENDARHAEAGAINAQKVARRLRLKGNDLSTLVFLVDHHLTMSEIARRKNLDDEDTIIEFARIVQSQERLDMLMLLTFADTLGTGSGRGYSDWKDLLLWQLYHRTTTALSGIKEFRAMAEKARLDIQQRLLKNLDRQFDPAEVVAHFENLPPGYFDTMSEDLIREHISIVHNFLKFQITHEEASLQPIVHWRNFPEQGHSEVTVVTWDRYHIFARVTGAFSACNLTILKADIFTRSDDIAIETYFVATERFEAVTDPRDRGAFEKILNEAMGTDDYDFTKAFAKRTTRPRYPTYDPKELPTRVSVDLRSSRTHSLLDVQTADYPGLLYRIACAIADSGMDLSSARVTTEKGAALDTFYLTDHRGHKVEDEETLGALIAKVRKRIAE
ncbi:MAG TPA: [protein-PII] uridylyltransferase [Candidatus Methylacidiphilales bacterium]|nr:[protein-PII] uridylyltransferase [Candidatus Methylacidiphilales bacterium]